MSNQATFGGLFGEDWDRRSLTGRYVITFRDDAKTEGLALLEKSTGIRGLPSTADFKETLDLAQSRQAGGAVFDRLGVAVVTMPRDAYGAVSAASAHDSAILAVEPERIMYALTQVPNALTTERSIRVSLEYLRGYRDSVSNLYEELARKTRAEEKLVAGEEVPAEAYDDTAESTWGLKATGVIELQYSGAGIRVAVLDTGLDLTHPDFIGREIVSQSFVEGQQVQDGHGHGTHCIGTACGPRNPSTGRRYGIAYRAEIYAGKVLSDEGQGSDEEILAGIEWAVTSNCHVISMSLGSDSRWPSAAYEKVGQRALQARSLIVAAAGNNAMRPWWRGFVGVPANSRSIMAVAAIDRELGIATFSARSSGLRGGEVDIAGPGVDVYSSWPMPTQYRSISGTSMATPHVAGIAALTAEAFGYSADALWRSLTAGARGLPLASQDVGAGLVQAPDSGDGA